MNTENTASKIFVLGHARSGTTIIADLLNSDDRVLLLYEAHMFESYWNSRFVANFNLHHRQAAVFKAKGKFLPSRFNGMVPEIVLQELAGNYDLIGEKVAIGPLSGLGSRAAAQAVDYHLSYHLDARYIMTFRSPVSSLFSLQTIFPQVSLAYLLQGWMLSFIELAAGSHLLQQVMLLPVEFMNMRSWETIRTRLAISGRAGAEWFAPKAARAKPKSAQAKLARALAAQLGWPLEQVEQFLQQLTEIYAGFLECIDAETLYYLPSVSFISQVGDRLITQVHQMVAQLSATVAPGLPSSVFSWQWGDDIRVDRRTLPESATDFQRFSDILQDRLFSDLGQLLLSDINSSYVLKTEGVDMQREDDCLRLQALPGVEHHKHLTVRVPITAMRVATVRFQLHKEESSRFLMVQVGDDSGFYNSLFDCRDLSATNMTEVGPVKNLFSRMQSMQDGTIRVSLSGMLSSGKGSYIRIYLCGDNASIDFDDTKIGIVVTDLVLGYLFKDSGMNE